MHKGTSNVRSCTLNLVRCELNLITLAASEEQLCDVNQFLRWLLYRQNCLMMFIVWVLLCLLNDDNNIVVLFT